MKKSLLAAGLTFALLGSAGAASAQHVELGVRIGDHHRHHRYHHRWHHHRRHYWWHGGWYTYRPRGWVYEAPPHPWGDPYWRHHHCWWHHHHTVCR